MRDGEYCRLATDDPGDDTRNFGETRVFRIENTTLANLSPVESEKVRVTADTTKAVFRSPGSSYSTLVVEGPPDVGRR